LRDFNTSCITLDIVERWLPCSPSRDRRTLNILLINHHAGSLKHGMEYRPYYMARAWVAAGHRVRIVAASHSHVRRDNPTLDGSSRLDERIDGIEYTWLRTPDYTGNHTGRIRNMLAFLFRLHYLAAALARSFRPDAVIASSTYPLDIFAAHRIARHAGARLLFEVHDLWPLSPIELGGYSPWHPFILVLQAAENYACRHADAIVSMLPNVRGHLENHGMAPEKLHIVPNGTDAAEWLGTPAPLSPAVTSALSGLRQRGSFIVGFAGSHGLANALDTLLDAAALLRDTPAVIVLVGDGPEKCRLQARARTEQLSNVHFFDALPKAQMPALLQSFDAAYIGLQRQPLFRFGISPNKLIDYMMAARPVLQAIEAGNNPVKEAGCGLTVAAENPAAVAEGIRTLLALPPAVRESMGARGRRFVLDNLTYDVLATRFLQACAGARPIGQPIPLIGERFERP
jgi:glycosyltransferase involved in cell wall biosynthesis